MLYVDQDDQQFCQATQLYRCHSLKMPGDAKFKKVNRKILENSL